MTPVAWSLIRWIQKHADGLRHEENDRRFALPHAHDGSVAQDLARMHVSTHDNSPVQILARAGTQLGTHAALKPIGPKTYRAYTLHLINPKPYKP